jgi:hypothetical protein
MLYLELHVAIYGQNVEVIVQNVTKIKIPFGDEVRYAHGPKTEGKKLN